VKIAAAVMIIAGASYLVFRSREATAAVPGAGEILYPVDNNRARRGRLTPAEAVQLVNQVNAEEGLGLNAGDVLAFMIVESNLDPTAYRYESHINDASYGLMQVLYRTAQSVGYDGPPAGLYEPLTGTRFGMRYIAYVRDYLAERLGRAPSWDEVASGYNGGPGRVVNGWRSVAYVAKWQRTRAGINVA
jgi:soluble lytic murein transglycosylase-like protein